MPEPRVSVIIKARDLASQVFRRFRRTLTSIKTGAVNVAKALAGIGVAVGGAVFGLGKLAERGGKVVTVQSAFARIVGDTTGALAELRKATAGLISNYDLMVGLNRSVTLGAAANQEQFAELATTALSLGRALGVDAAFALESLSLGIGRQSRLILDNLGLIVSVEGANKAYAKSLGITTAELTDNQKREAFRTAALEAARQKTAELGGVTLTAGDAFRRFATNLANVRDKIAELIAQSPVVTEFFTRLGDIADHITVALSGSSQEIKQAFALAGKIAGEAFLEAFVRAIRFGIDQFVQRVPAGIRRALSTLPGLGGIAGADPRFVQDLGEIADKLGTVRRQTQDELEALAETIRARLAELGEGTTPPLRIPVEVEAVNLDAEITALGKSIQSELDDLDLQVRLEAAGTTFDLSGLKRDLADVAQLEREVRISGTVEDRHTALLRLVEAQDALKDRLQATAVALGDAEVPANLLEQALTRLTALADELEIKPAFVADVGPLEDVLRARRAELALAAEGLEFRLPAIRRELEAIAELEQQRAVTTDTAQLVAQEQALAQAKAAVRDQIVAQVAALRMVGISATEIELIFNATELSAEAFREAMEGVRDALGEAGDAAQHMAANVISAAGGLIQGIINSQRGAGGLFGGLLQGVGGILSLARGVNPILGAGLTALGGVVGALSSDRRRAVPVRVDEFGSRALQQQRREGPDIVRVQIVAQGTGKVVDEIIYRLGRQTRKDGVVRIPTGSLIVNG